MALPYLPSPTAPGDSERPAVYVVPASRGSRPAGVRLRVRLGAAIALVLLGLAVAVLVSALGSPGVSASLPAADAAASGAPELAAQSAAQAPRIVVHLLGEVARPGLYELREGARGVDAVAAAGGFTERADRGQLNLARFVSDGEQIVIPAVGEQPAPGAGGIAVGGTVGGKVNINTADAAALETLPRVGPAMAARIIAWREANGRFGSIDDLRAVTGIGEKTFAALSGLVTV